MINKIMLKEWIRNNSAELFVLAVGTAISFVIGLAITGDVSQALAGSRRK